VLVAAIQAKPTDHLDQSSAERLATSVDAPLEAFEAFDVISRRAQSDQQLHIRTVIEHICPQRLDVGHPAEGYDEIDRAVTVHLVGNVDAVDLRSNAYRTVTVCGSFDRHHRSKALAGDEVVSSAGESRRRN